MLALLIGGHLLISLVLDHFGWVGFQVHEINAWRLLGTILMITGVILIVRN